MEQEFYNQGVEKAGAGDHAGAIEAFNRTLESNPEHTGAYFGRGLSRLSLGDATGALSDAGHVIRLNSNAAVAYNLRASAYRRLGELERAIAEFKKAAELYLEQKDAASCRRCLEAIQQLRPAPERPVEQPNPGTITANPEKEFYERILAKAQKGDRDGAMADITWALQVDSQDAKAYCCRGLLRWQQGEGRAALTDFNQALRLNSQDAVAYSYRGAVRVQLGDHQGAVADFNEALRIAPQDSSIYLNRGNAYRVMGNYLAAVADYEKVLQINPNDGKAYYYRGMAYACLEEVQKATEDYQQAAKLFFDRSDWTNYQKALESVKKLQSPATNQKEGKGGRQSQLKQRLLRLVGGHWSIAERLIEQAKVKTPGMSEEWYWEKVIYDLEQERG